MNPETLVLKATQDLIAGNVGGNYPVKLQVMSSYISSIIQFKHENDAANTNVQADLEKTVLTKHTPFLDTTLVGIEVNDVDGKEADDIISLPEFTNKQTGIETKIEPTLSPLPAAEKSVKTVAGLDKRPSLAVTIVLTPLSRASLPSARPMS
jgi:hypothetical protein